jgi:hypothetical protein
MPLMSISHVRDAGFNAYNRFPIVSSINLQIFDRLRCSGFRIRLKQEGMEHKNEAIVSHMEGTELKDTNRLDDDASSLNSEAVGDNLPPGYFYSWKFIGAFTVSSEALLILWTLRLVRDSVWLASVHTCS